MSKKPEEELRLFGEAFSRLMNGVHFKDKRTYDCVITFSCQNDKLLLEQLRVYEIKDDSKKALH